MASSTRRAVSAGVGGRGFGLGLLGARTASIGLNGIQPHGNAELHAADSTAWIRHTVAAASGRQTCGRHPADWQSCSPTVLWSIKVRLPQRFLYCRSFL